MKSFLKKYSRITDLMVVFAASATLAACGHVATGITLLGCFQLWQFASSKRSGVCFTTALAPEQVKEFEQLAKEMGAGWAEIKGLPALLKAEQKRNDDLANELKSLRKSSLARGKQIVHGGNVSDDCARHLGALALAVGIKRNQISGRMAEAGEALVKEVLGVEVKSALTSSDIPLPVEYSGQVAELVGQFGMARRYGTVVPLGAGTQKLPGLAADPTFGLIASSAPVDEKSPGAANVTFNAEKFGGLIRVPAEIEEDSIINTGQFIARYAARQIARAEDYNFFCSTGAGSGINGSVAGLTASTITNSKVVQMGTGKTAYSQATLANFRALQSVPDASAIRKGAYYVHPSMQQLLSSFNTSGDRPYNPNAQLQGASAAQPFVSGPTLDGFPVRFVDVLPVYSTSANASKVFALFGDLEFQYLGVRGGIRFDTSLEAGFTTDEILIRALERFTIGLMQVGAVAGLETAAS